jgi:hypothetical protein
VPEDRIRECILQASILTTITVKAFWASQAYAAVVIVIVGSGCQITGLGFGDGTSENFLPVVG